MFNTKENRIKWLEKVKTILMMGGKSKATFKNYRAHLNHFFNFYTEDTDFSTIREDEILVYIQKNYLALKRASSTTNVAICSITFLYAVCFKISLNKKLLPNPKLVKTIPTVLPKQNFIKIFNEEENLKHKCWFLLAYCSGLRSMEISSLKIENIIASEHKLKVLGKGNKERYTILPDVTIKFLRLYCRQNLITNKTGYLFLGNGGREHISHQSISGYFNNVIAKKYHLPKTITFHSLRHSFASYFLMNGGDLIVLQSLMGHSDIATTRRYIHFSTNYNHLEGINYV